VKRAMILGAALLALAACSTTHRLMEPDPAARNISPEKTTVKEGIDPVCGAVVKADHRFWYASHHGTEYYFDSEECKREFEENPDLFGAEVR